MVYGPLSNGGTTVLFESTPIYPDPGKQDISSQGQSFHPVEFFLTITRWEVVRVRLLWLLFTEMKVKLEWI